MYILDSSVWIALFLDFDTQHEKACEVIEFLNGKIFVPYCVISEVSTVLSYKSSKKQADLFLDYLDNNRDIIKLNNDYDTDIEIYKNVEMKVSFADVSIVSIAINQNLSLVTFDNQMKSLYKNLVNKNMD